MDLPELPQVPDRVFQALADLMRAQCGVRIGPEKRDLIAARLAPRLRARGVTQFADYWQQYGHLPEEQREIVDRLTTHETAFLREPWHFATLAEDAGQSGRRPYRVWCAAMSTGEEAWSAAIVLADRCGLGGSFSVTGSDVSVRAAQQAQQGSYPLDRCAPLGAQRLARYGSCAAGHWQVGSALRQHVRLQPASFLQPMGIQGPFQAILLRNVLIYFAAEDRAQVLRRMATHLTPGGLLFLGHAERLLDLTGWESLGQTTYRWIGTP